MADPEKYRAEGERMRREAAEATNPALERMMLDIASLYDRMANSLERNRERRKKL